MLQVPLLRGRRALRERLTLIKMTGKRQAHSMWSLNRTSSPWPRGIRESTGTPLCSCRRQPPQRLPPLRPSRHHSGKNLSRITSLETRSVPCRVSFWREYRHLLQSMRPLPRLTRPQHVTHSMGRLGVLQRALRETSRWKLAQKYIFTRLCGGSRCSKIMKSKRQIGATCYRRA